MGLTTRVLPPAEYHRLAGTTLETAAPTFGPEACVVVVEEDGRIVACGALFQSWHLDGAWVAEDKRGRPSVGRRLVEGLRAAIASVGARELITMVCDRDAARLHRAFGRSLHLAGDHFAIEVGSCHRL